MKRFDASGRPARLIAITPAIIAALTYGCTAGDGSRLATERTPAVTGASPSGKPKAPAVSSAANVAPGTARSAATHCSPAELVVFSCTIEETGRVISLCLDARTPDASARFVSGAPGRPHDTRVAADGTGSTTLFGRTALTYAGGSGGYAYSITAATGETRLLYSVSGENGLERQGEMLVDPDITTTYADAPCASGTVVESDDSRAHRAVRRWPSVPALERHGFPPASR